MDNLVPLGADIYQKGGTENFWWGKGYNPGLTKIEVPTKEQRQTLHTTDKALMTFQSNRSPNVIPGVAASGKLLDMQILQPHSKPKKSEIQVVEHSTQCLNSLSKRLP